MRLITTFTSINGEYLQTSINSTINKINELEPFYVATAIDCINSKQSKSHPYKISQDTCVEKAKIKGIVKIVTKQTFLNTVLENKQYLVKETEQFLLKMDSSSIGNRLM